MGRNHRERNSHRPIGTPFVSVSSVSIKETNVRPSASLLTHLQKQVKHWNANVQIGLPIDYDFHPEARRQKNQQATSSRRSRSF